MNDTKPVKIVEDYLFIRHEEYSEYKGRYMKTDVIPLADIECIKANVGPRGGMHSWAVKGYHPEYSENNDRDISIFSGDRKDSHLIDEIIKVLPEIKYHEKVEDGGAAW